MHWTRSSRQPMKHEQAGDIIIIIVVVKATDEAGAGWSRDEGRFAQGAGVRLRGLARSWSGRLGKDRLGSCDGEMAPWMRRRRVGGFECEVSVSIWCQNVNAVYMSCCEGPGGMRGVSES